ncbi:MAG TPA: CheR family methyltransferase [Bryobacteraceae bacterium]|nr:CheR family methyltransferase [Bryobacteraceae bacterium]
MPQLLEIDDDPAALSPAGFARFAQFITRELGIKMPESKIALVQSRLLRRVRDLKLRSVDQYSKYFFDPAHAEEREHLINAITTNKTDFFREPGHFEYLTGVVLPNFGADSRANRRFKAWSAGSSSGEEAYTIAIVLAEFASQQPGFDFGILGTDISTHVLAKAREGIYHQSLILPVAPELRNKYLMRGKNQSEHLARVVPELRKRVTFHQLNFMDDDYGIREMFDVVFFRNVMIYFERSTQEAVIRKICRNLVPGGYLFAGHSESLASLDVPLRPVRASIYRRVD